MLREEVAAGWIMNSPAVVKRRRTDGAPLQFVLDVITLYYTWSHSCTKCAQCVCTNTQISLRHTQSDCRQTHFTAQYRTEETLRAQPPFPLEVVLIQGTWSIYWHCTNFWFIWRYRQKQRHIISEYKLEVIGGIVNNIGALAWRVRVIPRMYSVRMSRITYKSV